MNSFLSIIRLFFLSSLCLIMFNPVTCSLTVHCNEKDTNILLKFKQRATDPSEVLSSWFSNSDCCQWRGVTCHNITGRVSELSLPCHTIPSHITALGEIDDKSHCLTGHSNFFLIFTFKFNFILSC